MIGCPLLCAANQEPACLLTQLLTMTTTYEFPSLGGEEEVGGLEAAVAVGGEAGAGQLDAFALGAAEAVVVLRTRQGDAHLARLHHLVRVGDFK